MIAQRYPSFKLEARQENGVKVTMYIQGEDFLDACKQRLKTFESTVNDVKWLNIYTLPDTTLIGYYEVNKNKMIYQDIRHSIAEGIAVLLGRKTVPKVKKPATSLPEPYVIKLEII